MEDLRLIGKQKVGERVLDILRKDIMLGQIKAGSHLKETVLSKELGVSRGPIREAIVQLENEGLVVTPPNGRTVVEGFSNQDVENLYNTRIQIEKYAISQLTMNAIQEGSAELHHYIHLMEQGLEKRERDVEADIQFHFMIIKFTNNKTLIQLWKAINGLIKSLIQVTTDFTVDQREIIEQHREVVNALEAGELEKAQLILEEHLEIAREFYKGAVERLRQGQSD